MILGRTLIGSLPFRDISTAVEFSREFELPCLPTLPNLNSAEFMQNMRIDDDSLITFSAQEHFLQSISKNSPFKWQTIGPVTAAKLMQDFNLERYKNSLFKKQNEFIKLGLKPVLFFDEPMLSTQSEYDDLSEFLNGFPHEVSIHCCCKVKVEEFPFSEVEGFSFDVSLYSEEELIEINEKKCTKYWGLLHTSSAEFHSLDVDFIQDGYVTPACGLAFTSFEKCDEIKRKLFQIV